MAVAAFITKDMIISEILEKDEGVAKFLLESGMHCLGCPSARGETLEDACEVHGADADLLTDKINAYLAEK
ncbi:MAG: DUF1858 domain-containing protein [Oscillospiraceae bacterium]|nr:DUF1858 domain-containing protein [Oscillospiraceae bacterium]